DDSTGRPVEEAAHHVERCRRLPGEQVTVAVERTDPEIEASAPEREVADSATHLGFACAQGQLALEQDRRRRGALAQAYADGSGSAVCALDHQADVEWRVRSRHAF